MTFVTAGLALAGAVSVIIPILIFLLWRQRRRPVPWGAMRFLLEAYRKHRRRLQVEQLLLLAIRCLLLLMLGLALARPLLTTGGFLESGGQRIVYLIVDDGLAAGLVVNEAGETALDQSRTLASAIIDELDPGDRIGVVTTALPARTILAPPSTDHAAVRRLINDLPVRDAASDLAGAISQLRSALAQHADENEPITVYLLSEFRAGSARLDENLPALAASGDTRFVLRALPPALELRRNVSVTAVDPVRRVVLAGATDGSEQVVVRLLRSGGAFTRDVTRVTLSGDALAPVSPRIVNWKQGQTEASVEFRLRFTEGRDVETGISIELDADDLAADNRRHVVLALRKRVRVTLIDRRGFGADRSIESMTSGLWMGRALEPTDDGPIEVITLEPRTLRDTDLRSTDVAILARPDGLEPTGWRALRSFVHSGGLLIVVPPGDANIHQWTDALRTELGVPLFIEREVIDHDPPQFLTGTANGSPLLGLLANDLEELTRPILVRRTLGVDIESSEIATVLSFADGQPFVVSATPRSDDGIAALGQVVYFAAAPQLDWTNLPSKPLMLPLFQELVRQGLSQIRGRRPVLVGEQPVLPSYRAATSLVHTDGAVIELDTTRRAMKRLDAAGVYRVEDHGKREIGALAVNIDPLAASADGQAAGAVGPWLSRSGGWSFLDREDPGRDLRRADGGVAIGTWLLLAVLVLALLELFLARWFSHAVRGSSRATTQAGGIRTTMHEAHRLSSEGS